MCFELIWGRMQPPVYGVSAVFIDWRFRNHCLEIKRKEAPGCAPARYDLSGWGGKDSCAILKCHEPRKVESLEF